MPDHVDILGVRIDTVSREQVEERIVSAVEGRRCEYFAYANIHAVNIAQRDARFCAFLNGASVVYCDGEGVRLGARILGVSLPPRIVMTYWIWELSALFEKRGFSLYLLGGAEPTVARAVENLRSRFPHLRIVGSHHGYFDKDGRESDAVIKEITEASPDIILICFGMPLQEHWAMQNRFRLGAHVILFGGSTIDYAAGLKSVAPHWMAANGLEWLYRMIQEPRRLWRRYLLGNPAFVFRVMLQRLRGGSLRS